MKPEDAAVSAFNPVNWSEDDAVEKPQTLPQNSPDQIKKRMQTALAEFKTFSEAQEATINGIVAAVDAKDKTAEQKIQDVSDNVHKLQNDFIMGINKLLESFAVDINLI